MPNKTQAIATPRSRGPPKREGVGWPRNRNDNLTHGV
jgi:hypothetical protein